MTNNQRYIQSYHCPSTGYNKPTKTNIVTMKTAVAKLEQYYAFE